MDDEATIEDTKVEDPHGSEDGVDWKAESRKWEKRAKENSAAAEELKKLKDASEKTKSALESLQKEQEAIKAKEERAQWNKSVSEKTGVPVEVLASMVAESEDDLMKKSSDISSYFEKQIVPPVAGDGTHAGSFTTAKQELAQKMFGRN